MTVSFKSPHLLKMFLWLVGSPMILVKQLSKHSLSLEFVPGSFHPAGSVSEPGELHAQFCLPGSSSYVSLCVLRVLLPPGDSQDYTEKPCLGGKKKGKRLYFKGQRRKYMFLTYKTLLPFAGTGRAVGTEKPREQGLSWFCLMQPLLDEQVCIQRCA